MYKVLLICAGGMSTGFILKKIEAEAAKRNIELTIKAVGSLEVKDIWTEYDLFLVAPQVRFELENVKKITENSKKVTTIDPATYGSMDGSKILDLIISM